MRKVVVASADATRSVLERNGQRWEAVFVTGTYRPGAYYSPDHIGQLVTHMRNWARRRGVKLRYQWVMEIQRRGAPHYHLIAWVPKGFRFPKPDEQGWWPHGMSNIKLARRAVGYLVKYATKGDADDHMPKGARLFGVGGLDAEDSLATHRARLPRWLADTVRGRARRVVRVGWVDLETGEIHRSPWRIEMGRDESGHAYIRMYRLSTLGLEAAAANLSQG